MSEELEKPEKTEESGTKTSIKGKMEKTVEKRAKREKKRSERAISRPYFQAFFRHNHLNWAVYLITTVLSALTNMVVSWLLGEVMDTAAARDGAGLMRLLWFTVAFLLAVVAVDLTAQWSKTQALRRGVSQYKSLAFRKLSEKSISAFSKENTGRYISTLTNDVTAIETDYLLGIPALVEGVVGFVGALVMMCWYSPLMTLAVVLLCLPSAAASVLMGGELSKRTQAVSDRNESFVGQIKDLLTGFPVIKSFKAEREVGWLFDESDADLERTKARKRWWRGLLNAASSATGSVMQFGIFFIGAMLAVRGDITTGTVLIFVNLCNPLIGAIGIIPQYWAELQAARGLVVKLAQAVEENAGRSGKAIEPVLNDAIRLRDVTFGYEEGKPVLKDVDLTMEKGKKYAVVGASGSGKSTLLSLLMGAYDGYEGSITVDGRELRDISTDSLYDLESLIGQNVFLFDDTIGRNITMFRDFPKEAVDSAVERSGLGELVAAKGEDYSCGENGGNLSGGERQRVSIARCLLRETPVLLLDEATAALDNQTAFSVVDSILKLDGLTRLVVTHRLEKELLEQYDEILVMKNGEICEKGRFDELMEGKGTFYSLYTLSA